MSKHKNLLPHNIEKYPFYKKSKGRDFLFFHIPKTGGTSINRAFKFSRPNPKISIKKHYSLAEIKPLIDESLWENAFKFCFVRNPWDRIYSHYRFRSSEQRLKKEEHYGSFEKWLFYRLLEKKKLHNLKPQIEWIKDANGDVKLDFIGRFENIQEDFQKICELNNLKASLPHINKSSNNLGYKTQFDNEMLDLVAEAYKADIEYFNYSFP